MNAHINLVNFELPKIDENRKMKTSSSSSSLYTESHLISQDSIINSLQRFLKAVNNMNEIVMVPSKLHDLQDDNDVKSIISLSSDDGLSSGMSSNLYDSYKMLVQAKEDLLWGVRDDNEANEASPYIQFRHHLQELNHLLNRFSDISHSLSSKYQSETGFDY